VSAVYIPRRDAFRYMARIAVGIYTVALSACITPDWYERKPDPPERCIVISDGVNTVCVAESKVREWAKRNGM